MDKTLKKIFDSACKELKVEGNKRLEEINTKYDLGLNRDVSTIYHYTTVDGLKGIISSNTLWATNLAYCNDAGEFNYGKDQFIKVAEKAVEKYQGSAAGSIFVRILEILKRKTRSDSYICCFAQKGDQLSQ